MKLLLMVNVDWFFLSHRLAIAKGAVAAGWEVHLATTLTEDAEKLGGHGFVVHDVPIHRSSWNPFGLVLTLARYVKLIRSIRPDVVHLVTIKPVLLGGLVARFTRVPGVVFAVSGLGHVFVAKGRLGKVRRALVRSLYRLAMSRENKVVIFQNDVDEAELVRLGCVASEQVVRLPGSGFDVDAYEVSPLPSGTPVFLMASRLIRTKGVIEFCDAASRLASEGVDAEFWLVGAPDPANPEGLSLRDLAELERIPNLTVLGQRGDVPDLMRSAAAVVLPSYYGEGLPKVLIEAAAAGRAVITTDTPGCRDAIEDRVTGLLVPQQDVEALAGAMRELTSDRELLGTLGRNGRARAERLFRIQDVVAEHLRVYDALSGRVNRGS
ncbi:glycosyltransferase family 4 protein [Dietzia maris]|nr:glycosyltransferase family 4 protein [Dietzia maris]MBB0996448.1 glycosyltransferase family 4 protein [Dietzia maris]